MEPSPGDQPATSETERDALRVQAAAVAAQQMALTLEEERLRQRGSALARQESQLAAHLEERRGRLLELQEQVRKDRESLKAERAELEAEREEEVGRLVKERAEAVAATDAARKERTRLIELRKRLRQRWQRHWDAREADFKRRDEDLAARRTDLSEQSEALRRERSHLSQTRLQVNGEVELGRRKLQEGWEELSLSQQEWEVCLNYENSQRQRRSAELESRESALAAAEQRLAENQREWTRRQAELAGEVAGLENRVGNLRSQLSGLQPVESLPWLATAETIETHVRAVSETLVPEALERLAGDLADQRRHLLEQWGRLLDVQSRWEAERVALLADLEATAGRFDERERQLNARQSVLAAEEAALRQLQKGTDQERNNLEGWRARLAVREGASERERLSLLSEVQAREESAARQTARMQELRARLAERRRQELADLRSVRQRCEHARGIYLEMWHECQARRTSLAREQRDLAAKELALERMRQDLLSRAPDAAAAERRLAKLGQRPHAAVQAGQRELAKAQKAVVAEIARLDAEWHRFREEEAALVARSEAFTRLQEEWDRSKAAAESEADGREREMRLLQDRHARDTREIGALREEVEVIARHLIDGESVASRETRQAA